MLRLETFTNFSMSGLLQRFFVTFAKKVEVVFFCSYCQAFGAENYVRFIAFLWSCVEGQKQQFIYYLYNAAATKHFPLKMNAPCLFDLFVSNYRTIRGAK